MKFEPGDEVMLKPEEKANQWFQHNIVYKVKGRYTHSVMNTFSDEYICFENAEAAWQQDRFERVGGPW